jgi:hypothetical protein
VAIRWLIVAGGNLKSSMALQSGHRDETSLVCLDPSRNDLRRSSEMTAHRGDVDSSAFVRWLGLQRSAGFVAQQLQTLPATSIRADVPAALAADSIVASLAVPEPQIVIAVGTPAMRPMPAAQNEPHALRSGATLAPIIDEAERRERVAWTSI